MKSSQVENYLSLGLKGCSNEKGGISQGQAHELCAKG